MNDDSHGRADAAPTLFLRKMTAYRYAIPGWGMVHARLWRMTSRYPPAVYAVELTGLGTRRLCVVGRDEAAARALLARLARHRVTPVGLVDLLEELE